MLGNSFLIEYDKNAIKRYERMVLSDNSCSGFLPMNFIVREDSIIAGYNAAGYVPFSMWHSDEMKDILMLIESIGGALLTGLTSLIMPEDVLVNPETIYIKQTESNMSVKLAFMPVRAEENKNSYSYADFIREMVMRYRGIDELNLLQSISDYIYKENPPINGIINKAGECRRTLYRRTLNGDMYT